MHRRRTHFGSREHTVIPGIMCCIRKIGLSIIFIIVQERITGKGRLKNAHLYGLFILIPFHEFRTVTHFTRVRKRTRWKFNSITQKTARPLKVKELLRSTDKLFQAVNILLFPGMRNDQKNCTCFLRISPSFLTSLKFR